MHSAFSLCLSELFALAYFPLFTISPLGHISHTPTASSLSLTSSFFLTSSISLTSFFSSQISSEFDAIYDSQATIDEDVIASIEYDHAEFKRHSDESLLSNSILQNSWTQRCERTQRCEKDCSQITQNCEKKCEYDEKTRWFVFWLLFLLDSLIDKHMIDIE